MDEPDRTPSRLRVPRRMATSAPRWLQAMADELLSCPAGIALVELLT